MKKLKPDHLIAFEHFSSEPLRVDLAYAQSNHPRNIFETALYHANAKCWAHKDLAAITLLAARIVHHKYEWILEIKDCLRTSNAQAAMQYTDIVKANPQWMEEPRMLAPPGAGGHPRGMAVDVHPIDKNGNLVDMGTPFDWMESNSARDWTDFSEIVLENRKKLESAFIESAKILNADFIPYPAEWWDFRYTNDYYEQFAPLADEDLPRQMQMTGQIDTDIDDFPPEHFERLAEEITSLVDKAYADL